AAVSARGNHRQVASIAIRGRQELFTRKGQAKSEKHAGCCEQRQEKNAADRRLESKRPAGIPRGTVAPQPERVAKGAEAKGCRAMGHVTEFRCPLGEPFGALRSGRQE